MKPQKQEEKSPTQASRGVPFQVSGTRHKSRRKNYLLKHPEETWAERLTSLEQLVVDHHPLWKEIDLEKSKAYKL